MSFSKAVEELKISPKVVDNNISDKRGKNPIKYKPKKVQFQLNNMIIYDLENINTDKCVTNSVSFYKLSKISGKYYRDITDRQFQKCKIDCGVFKGTNCINKMLGHALEFEGERKSVRKKFLNFICTSLLTTELDLTVIKF